MFNHTSEHKLGKMAWLDRLTAEQEGILVRVQAVMFRPGGHALYEVSWLHNGANHEMWVYAERLTKTAAPD